MRIGGLTHLHLRGLPIRLASKGADGHQICLNNILNANAIFSIIVSNELWFIGDKFLQNAFAVMMDNKKPFPSAARIQSG